MQTIAAPGHAAHAHEVGASPSDPGSESMATDYDAPRKTEDDSESIEALKERVPDKLSGSVDVEDSDNPSGFELPGADLSDLELDVVVVPVVVLQQPARDAVALFLLLRRLLLLLLRLRRLIERVSGRLLHHFALLAERIRV